MRIEKILLGCVLIAVALVWGAAGSAGDSYELGHVSVTVYDPDRDDRPIPTEIFYPAEEAGEGVPLVPAPSGGFPVVVVGHAFLTGWNAYAYLWTALVAEGFMVAVLCTEATWFADPVAFGADLACVCRLLPEASADPASPFFDGLSAKTAVLGHSFGGGATILAAREGPAIRAVVNLAAQNGLRSSPANLADEVTAPALVFAASHDCVTPPASHQLPIYENLASSWKTYVCLEGGSHCQFSGSDSDCHSAESGCPAPTLAAAQQQAIVLDLLLPWLAAVLKDDQAAGDEFQRRLEAASDISFLQAGALPVHRSTWGRLKHTFR